MRIFLYLFFLVFAIVPSGIFAHKKVGVAAYVGNHVILYSDVERNLKLIDKVFYDENVNLYEDANFFQAKILSEMIDEELFIQAAKDLSIEVDDDDVSKAIGVIADSLQITREVLEERMAEIGVSISVLEKKVTAGLVWERLVQSQLIPMININEQEVRAFMKQREKFGDKIVFYQLVDVWLPSESNDADKKMANLRHKLVKGADITSIKSEVESAGGTVADIPQWVNIDAFIPDVKSSITKIDTGVWSDIFQVEDRYVFFKVMNRTSLDYSFMNSTIDAFFLKLTGGERQADFLRRNADSCEDLVTLQKAGKEKFEVNS